MSKNLHKTRTLIYLSCCVTCVLIIAVAVAQVHRPTNETLSENEYITQSQPYVITTKSSLAIDISNPRNMADLSQYIAIATIDTIDGTDNYSSVGNEYVLPYTYGRMTIVESIKGELPVGEQFTFYRLGGTISVDKYYEGLSDVEKERFDSAKEKNNELATANQVEVVNEDNIRIESGKTYLVYMVDEHAYQSSPNTYSIIGFQGGLREVQSETRDSIQASSNSSIKVLNNFTGEWENLDAIIEQK